MTEKRFIPELNQEVEIVRKSNIKNINIRVRPFKGITLSAPDYASHKEIEQVLKSKIKWLQQAITKIESKENAQTIFRENSAFSTCKYHLNIQKYSGRKVMAGITEGSINIRYPESVGIEHEIVQKIIRKGIEKAWEIEANDYLPGRIRQISKQINFPYKNLLIKNHKSIWGSCSFDNIITLNIHLMRLPQYLQDYVILHELCHIKEKNHSKAFWDLLNKYSRNKALELRKELMKYSPKIY